MEHTSLFGLVMSASLVVQLIMLGLLLVSVASWAFIIGKTVTLGRAKKASDEFERLFWGGVDLNRLYEDIRRHGHKGGMDRLFQVGFSEFLKWRSQSGVEVGDMTASAYRAMKAAAQRELDELDNHIPFLATVGSVSPYVGLFGTVWGIMHAFIGLSNTGQGTLSTVAPGIAEALIATAIGLFAAIPAVVAYNRFATDVDRLANRYDNYMEEFINILQRSSLRKE